MAAKQRIYLDHNASTPIAPEVAAVMGDAMAQGLGNPSSLHWAGRAPMWCSSPGRRTAP